MDGNEISLEQRRRELQERLAAQRGLVTLRVLELEPQTANRAANGMTSGNLAAHGLHVSPAYPRSMTLRLARAHPALAIGALALGLTLILRGRGDQLNDILSLAKAVEPLFGGDDPENQPPPPG